MPDYQRGKIYKIWDNEYNECYVGSTIQELSVRMAGHRANYKQYLKSTHNAYITSFNIFEKYGLENCRIELLELYPCNSKEELLAREGYFIRNHACVNKAINGRTYTEWYEDNKEQLKDKHKEYYEQNKERVLSISKAYRQEHKDKIRKHNQEYQQQNKDHISEYNKEYRNKNQEQLNENKRLYYQENKEHLKAKTREYQHNNKEHCQISKKAYAEKNKEVIAQKQKQYRENNLERLREYDRMRWERDKEKRNERVVCECGLNILRRGKNTHCKSKTHQQYLNSLNQQEPTDEL